MRRGRVREGRRRIFGELSGDAGVTERQRVLAAAEPLRRDEAGHLGHRAEDRGSGQSGPHTPAAERSPRGPPRQRSEPPAPAIAAPPSAKAPIAVISHIQSTAALTRKTTKAAVIATQAPTSLGSASSARALPGHREQPAEQPEQEDEPDDPELGEELEVERVRVAHELRVGRRPLPPELVAAGPIPVSCLLPPSVDRRVPEVVSACRRRSSAGPRVRRWRARASWVLNSSQASEISPEPATTADRRDRGRGGPGAIRPRQPPGSRAPSLSDRPGQEDGARAHRGGPGERQCHGSAPLASGRIGDLGLRSSDHDDHREAAERGERVDERRPPVRAEGDDRNHGDGAGDDPSARVAEVDREAGDRDGREREARGGPSCGRARSMPRPTAIVIAPQRADPVPVAEREIEAIRPGEPLGDVERLREGRG